MNAPRFVTANGVRLAYEDVGEGPAVLFIHGFMFDRTMWHAQIVALEGWRRIAADLRGMGISEAPEGGYSMDVYADDLAALLDAIGVERTVVCGLSMGGYVAFRFLRRHRNRVRALIIMDARAEADTAERSASRRDAIVRVRNGGASALTQEIASSLVAERASPATKARLEEMMDRTPVPGVVGALEAMRDRPDSRTLLQDSADLPTLLVIGRHDTRTPRASMQAIADLMPAATLEVIPDAGHVAPLESPAETTARIRRFLGEVARR